MAKPVLPKGAATIDRAYAMTIPEEIRGQLVKSFCGELMLFEDYCRVQQSICDGLRAKNRSIPEDYWQKFELTKYDDGKVVARKRSEELVTVDADDGTAKMVATKVATFSYSSQSGLNGERRGKYRDEDRIIMQDLACEPEVKEVAAWVTERE